MIHLVTGAVLGLAFYVVEVSDLTQRLTSVGNTSRFTTSAPWPVPNAIALLVVLLCGGVLLISAEGAGLDWVDVMVLVSLAFAAASVFWAQDKKLSRIKASRWLLVTGTALITGIASTFAQVVMLVSSGCAIYLLIGMLEEWRVGAPVRGWYYRFWGGVGSNKQAAHCVLLGLCCLYLYRAGLMPLPVAVTVLFVSGTILVSTRSLTNIGAATVAFPGWTFFVAPHWRSAILYAVAIAIVVISVMWCSRVTRHWLQWAMKLGRTDAVFRTLSGRPEIWRRSLTALRQHPLVGLGYGGFSNVRMAHELRDQKTYFATVEHAHSLYLELLLNGGVVALGLFVAMCGTGVYYAVHAPHPDGGFIVILLIFVMIHGTTESTFALPVFRTFALVAFLAALG